MDRHSLTNTHRESHCGSILLMRGQQVGANPRHHQRGVRPKGEEPGGRPLQSNWTIPCDKSFVDDLEWNGVL